MTEILIVSHVLHRRISEYSETYIFGSVHFAQRVTNEIRQMKLAWIGAYRISNVVCFLQRTFYI